MNGSMLPAIVAFMLHAILMRPSSAAIAEGEVQ